MREGYGRWASAVTCTGMHGNGNGNGNSVMGMEMVHM